MASLKEVRNRIRSVQSTQQITKAMKMVAAAKLRKAQDGIIQLRPYAGKLNEILTNLAGGSDVLAENSFSKNRGTAKVLIVVITSDRGLCGPFNSNVLKNVSALLLDKYAEQHAAKNVSFLCIGKRGFEFFGKRYNTVIGEYSHILNGLNFNKAKEAAEYVMAEFEKGTYDVVDIVYNEFKNVATQILCIDQLLPIVGNIEASGTETKADYIFEPSVEQIINEIVPKSLKIKFYKALLESNASEQGARMTAMDKATENAGELIKDLKITYNRTRQAAITKEILEIVGGAEALAAK
ncbi:MAG: ATP synthase F1 subunit gamma [Bacteroidota bacterium]|nr:ATP synthase F1 subunit gamma [Bacteroidota bacterium]